MGGDLRLGARQVSKNIAHLLKLRSILSWICPIGDQLGAHHYMMITIFKMINTFVGKGGERPNLFLKSKHFVGGGWEVGDPIPAVAIARDIMMVEEMKSARGEIGEGWFHGLNIVFF